MPPQTNRESVGHILGIRVDATTLEDATDKIIDWSSRRESRYVCAVNVHSVVTSLEDAQHQAALAESDFNLPDGFPIAKLLEKQGYNEQQRVSGPDITIELCAMAEISSIPIYFYGSTDTVLTPLINNLHERFPQLRVTGRFSPPFRELTPSEMEDIGRDINQSGAQLVFVGLGCPKQEAWMAAQKDDVNAVMIGVGAAFDFLAGAQKRAPRWLQSIGLEWLYRLVKEPRRLGWRYIRTNVIFGIKLIAGVIEKRSARKSLIK